MHLWFTAAAPPAAIHLESLSADERERAARFMFDADRSRFQAGRCLLRHVLSCYADLAPACWRFAQNAWGKPEPAGGQIAEPLYFSISHAGETVVCAVARCRELGVDVEDRAPDGAPDIARRFFAPAELDWLLSAQDPPDARLRFLTIWTLKEAYLKARGTGLAAALDSFSILPSGGDSACLVAARAFDDSADRWFFFRGHSANGRLALAYRPPAGEPVRLSMFHADLT